MSMSSMILHPMLLPHPQCDPPPFFARAFCWVLTLMGFGCVFRAAWVVLKHAYVATCTVGRGLRVGLLLLLDDRPG